MTDLLPSPLLRPLAGWKVVGTISRFGSHDDKDQGPTGGRVELSEHRSDGRMLRVIGLGESERAQVRMACDQAQPFDYSEDGLRWTPLDDEDAGAFRVYGLLDPRQVLQQMSPTTEDAEESISFRYRRIDLIGRANVSGQVDLRAWDPPLPPDFLDFLYSEGGSASAHEVEVEIHEGRMVSMTQRDIPPRDADVIRVDFAYRPTSIRTALAWLVELVRRRVSVPILRR